MREYKVLRVGQHGLAVTLPVAWCRVTEIKASDSLKVTMEVDKLTIEVKK